MRTLRRGVVRGSSAIVWLAPLVVAVAVRKYDGRLEKPVLALIGLACVLLAARHPGRAVLGLIVGLPFSTFILAFLFSHGVPGNVVRILAFWKEALVGAILLAALRKARHEHHRLDALDVVALSFLAIGLLYYRAPRLFIPADFPIPSSYIRELGLREDGLFVLLFLGARHARLDRRWAERAARGSWRPVPSSR